jgi:quinol monooxygenase YgiN
VICYLIKLRTKPYKSDEFLNSMHSLLRKILKENDCIGANLYVDSDKENSFAVVGEWNTQEAMELHFQKPNYEILIGSARVLCETMEMSVSEVIETGSFKMAKKYIALPKLAGGHSD